MSVELTSPVLGLAVGATYTGPEEDWLLAEGYAKRAGYTGVGVSNTGATDVTPDKDPSVRTNRESAYDPRTPGDVEFVYDFDINGRGVADTEAANVEGGLVPAEGKTAGGTRVRIYGDNLEGVTAVSFGGTAGTSLDVTADEDGGYIDVTTPAHAAGVVNVVLTDASGNDTVTGGFKYIA